LLRFAQEPAGNAGRITRQEVIRLRAAPLGRVPGNTKSPPHRGLFSLRGNRLAWPVLPAYSTGAGRLPLFSCRPGLNGTSGAGRAVGGTSSRLGSVISQAPPTTSRIVVHTTCLLVPGMGIRTVVTLLRTHSSSSVSLGRQYRSNAVGS